MSLYQKVLNDISNLNGDYWITANAGCGKTTKLVARFLFLLRNDILPENILCITYTNAGANEMKQRILEEIKKDNGFSEKSVKDMDNRLFISTIHGFCKDFLQKKGIINKNTEILSSNTQRIKDITRQIIDKPSDSSELTECIDFIAKTHTLQEFYKLITSIIENQNNFRNLVPNLFDNFNAKKENLDEELKNVIFPELWELKSFNEQLEYRKISELLRSYERLVLLDIASRNTKKSFNLDIFDLKNWKDVVLTTAGGVRKKLVPKEYQQNPDIVDMLVKIQNYFVGCNDFYRLQDCLSVLKLAYYVIREYELIKKQQNIITYDDMLFETKKLAIKGDLPNVEYLMLDEAQDTNPISWEIISFFKNNKQQPSRLFVVGDIKQSIYGFQGADVRFYKKYHNLLKERCLKTTNIKVGNDYNKRTWFDDVNLNLSYRSYKGILDFVDEFCNNTSNKVAFCENIEDVIQHKTVKDEEAVVKEIKVDLIADTLSDAENKDDETDWIKQMQLNLLKQKTTHDNALTFSNKIIDVLNDCCLEHDKKEKSEKITTAIIVPKRTSSNGFVYQIIEELRKKVYINIPIDLQLSSLLFYDLLSILKFSVLQYDDISLAIVLKSKIFNINDNMILSIRDDKDTLWQNLLAHEWQDNFKEAVVFFKKIIKMQSIRSIIDDIKSICKLRKCSDVYHEYISLLDKIYQHYIGNNGDDCDIRDFIQYVIEQGYKNDITNNGIIPCNVGTNHFVFFYTVHGVKGLEFDNVILLDFEKRESSNRNELLFFDSLADASSDIKDKNNYFFYKKGSIIGGTKEVVDAKIKQKKERNNCERKRLLYVAITRAKKRFYYYFGGDNDEKNPF